MSKQLHITSNIYTFSPWLPWQHRVPLYSRGARVGCVTWGLIIVSVCFDPPRLGWSWLVTWPSLLPWYWPPALSPPEQLTGMQASHWSASLPSVTGQTLTGFLTDLCCHARETSGGSQSVAMATHLPAPQRYHKIAASFICILQLTLKCVMSPFHTEILHHSLFVLYLCDPRPFDAKCWRH